MPAKTILTILFLISLGVAVIVFLHALPQPLSADTRAEKNEILVATTTLPAGTLLRAKDVAWQATTKAEPGQILRPSGTASNENAELDQQARGEVYGAAMRVGVKAGDPIGRSAIVKPGDRDFLLVVLSPGARAIAIPVATGGASTGLLYPGDRVDVILTQSFTTDPPLTRRSVSETMVGNLRVLAIDAGDKQPSGDFGRTVTLEVTPVQAEKINVATDLGKLSLTLRSASGVNGFATAEPGPGQAETIKPTWAGDVSPALGGMMPAEKQITAEQPPVLVLHGSRSESVKE